MTLINNGIYGSDSTEGAIRPTLVRSPGYCVHPISDRPLIVQDRFSPRLDQGERLYTFWLNAGPAAERLAQIEREALAHNEQPYALSFFPDGDQIEPVSSIVLEDEVIQLSAWKKAEDSEDLVVRLFEPTGHSRQTTVSFPTLGLRFPVELEAFEIGSFLLNPTSHAWRKCTLMEE